MHAVFVTSHPIQYQAPLFRELARQLDLTVVFLMRQTPQGQSAGGFGVAFEWDTPLLEGYRHVFANNIATEPSPDRRDGIVLSGHEALLASLQPDAVMVMGWFPRGKLQAIQWAAQAGVPLVQYGEANRLSGRSLLKRLVKQFYFRRLFQKFSSFAVIGKLNQEFYRHYGVPASRLHWAPYSVNTDFFASAYRQHRPVVRRPGPWRIGLAGKLIPKKRPLDLIQALALSASKDKVELILIGDGPLRGEVERLAANRGVRVTIRGFLNQSEIVPRGYADLDALVLPSGEFETWGLVVNEAMTGGIPAIVSDLVGCAPDLITEGQTGYVFPSGNPAALQAAIEKLVARLEQGHDFSPAVRARIAGYALSQSVQGVAAALRAAANTGI